MQVMARLVGLQPGEPKEGHAIDTTTAKRIPENLIGKCLSTPRRAGCSSFSPTNGSAHDQQARCEFLQGLRENGVRWSVQRSNQC